MTVLPKRTKKRLQVLQNNALRAIMKVDNRHSATELHETLQIEWLDVARKRHTCAEVFKLLKGTGPTVLVNMFKPIVPTRILRSNDTVKLQRPRTNTDFACRNFVVRGMTYWESLPIDVQTAPSNDCLEQHLKKNAHVFEHIT